MFLSRRCGVYYLWYTDTEGKRHKVSTKSTLKSNALAFVREFKPKRITSEREDLDFSTFIERFISFCKSTYQPGTIDLYRLALNSFLSIKGNCTLRSVTAFDLDMYKSTLLTRMRPVTVNMRLAKLKAAFNTAKRWGQIEKNPFENVKMVSIAESVPIHLSREEFRTLYWGIKEQWLKDVAQWAVLTGMRRGEIVNLRWNQVDLCDGTVLIQTNPTYRTKMGRKRVLPISDEGFRLLTKKGSEARDQNDLVFKLNGQAIYEDWVTHKFKKYVKELLPNNPGVHFHSLRSTFATILVREGTSLYEIQKLLGHSSIAVTQVYSHLAPNELHQTVNKLKLDLGIESQEKSGTSSVPQSTPQTQNPRGY